MAGNIPKLVDKGFQNWIKANLALNITKEGIEDAVLTEINTFHQDTYNDILSPEQILNNDLCRQCKIENLLPCPVRGICIVKKGLCSFHYTQQKWFRPCPKHICDRLREKIRRCHNFNFPSWKNTKAEYWCQNPWELAKCYLPPDGYLGVSSIAETDINGIVSVIMNLSAFKNKVNMHNCGQVREVTGRVRNSLDLCINDQDLNNILDTLVAFLSASLFHGDLKAATSVQNIAKLKMDSLTITTNFVTNILQDVTHENTKKSMQVMNEKQAERVHEINVDLDKLYEVAKVSAIDDIEGSRRTVIDDIKSTTVQLKTELNSDIDKVKTQAVAEIEEMKQTSIETEYQRLKAVPDELLNPRDVDMYLKAIEEGKERDRLVRVMVVGHFAQGKTSLTRRLFGQSVEGVESTNGIEVHSKQCDKNGTHWKNKPSVEHVDDMTSRLVNVASKLLNTDEQQIGDTTDISDKSNGPVEYSNEPIAENSRTYSTESEYDANSLESKYANSLESKYDAQSVESKYDKDLVAQFAQKMNASKTCSSAVMDQDDAIDINVWDFGGQFVFYATHQIFHSKNAIYLLVFNLKESFDSMLIDEDFPNNKYTMKSCLAFWMESVHSFVGSNDGKEPTVILVGTHKGNCDGKENKQLEAAKDIACETGTINHIYPIQFAVECIDPHDKSLELLRSDLYKLGQEKTQHKMIPAKWIPLEKKFLEVRNKKIVRLVDILKIDSENSHPIQDEEQVKLCLKYHHEKGGLIFFDEEKLHEFVVLDPQFLIDAFKCIITSQRFYRWRPDLKDLGDKLMTSGILEMDLLDEIWGNDETNQFYAFKDILLVFMQRLRILAEMKDVTDTTRAEHVERRFLVPSLLKGQADEKVMDAFLHPCKRKSNISLILELENISVLPLIFQRVMAAVLAKWSPVFFPDRNPLLFRDIGVFLLNYQHAGLIAVHSGGLEMAVVNLCPTGPVVAAVCDQFRRYIEMVILLEFGKFSSGSEKDLYKYYLRCNHSEHGRKGSRNVHDLKKVMGYQEVCCPDHGHHVVNMRESIDQWFKKDNMLPDDDIPDRQLTDKALSKIAQAIGKNWKLLGIDLGLGQDDVDRCEIDNLTSGVKTTIYYILKEWRTRYPEQNSMKFLIRQMKECEGLTVNWDKVNNIIDNF